MEVVRIVGDIKFIAVFRCTVCGRDAPGKTDTVQIDSTSMDGFMQQVIGIKQRNAYMPIGWASYGANTRRCPNCQ